LSLRISLNRLRVTYASSTKYPAIVEVIVPVRQALRRSQREAGSAKVRVQYWLDHPVHFVNLERLPTAVTRFVGSYSRVPIVIDQHCLAVGQHIGVMLVRKPGPGVARIDVEIPGLAQSPEHTPVAFPIFEGNLYYQVQMTDGNDDIPVRRPLQ
jgi:hypothetical protein